MDPICAYDKNDKSSEIIIGIEFFENEIAGKVGPCSKCGAPMNERDFQVGFRATPDPIRKKVNFHTCVYMCCRPCIIQMTVNKP